LQFSKWFDEATKAEIPEPNAMCLATCTPDGFPSARIVLLKGVDARGFAFYTDYRSRKGAELADNPHAALCFHWHALERQVRIAGPVEFVSREESQTYYSSRPQGSRIGAWASEQSRPLANRDELEARVRAVEAQYAHAEIPLPDHWGGYRVVPHEIELWQGRPSRLHDRISFVRQAEVWVKRRLSP